MVARICLLLFVTLSWLETSLGKELPQLLVDDIVVTEGADATLTLTLSSPSNEHIRITASTLFGSAKSGSDYVSVSKRITFEPGITEIPITVKIIDDETDEHEQFFWLLFRNAIGVTLPENRARISIQDNDPEPRISFERDIQEFQEGTHSGFTTAKIRIRLSHRSDKFVRFTIHTAPNTASAREFHYVAERILFDSKSLYFDYEVKISADSDLEGRQQFFLFMRNPFNATLDTTTPDTDRLKTTIRILDDDKLTTPSKIQSTNSFMWVGTFGRRFSRAELDAVTENTSLVVLAKFHAEFDIELHHQEVELLKFIKPSLKVFPYFNAKHWFVENRWATEPDIDCLLKDIGEVPYQISTDRSDAHYYDLRDENCRSWMLNTIQSWMGTGLYDGLAFDSTGPIGDYGDGDFWQNILGNQHEVDRWNAGLASLLFDANNMLDSLGLKVIFNGIGYANHRGQDRDRFQLTYTDGALNESFALDTSGAISPTLEEDIDFMQSRTDKILLMKTNVFDNGDPKRAIRLGNFAYASFLMGWAPGKSFFKFGLDDFYTTAELENFAISQQLDVGKPIGAYSKISNIYSREYTNYFVFVNPTQISQTVRYGATWLTIAAMDSAFIKKLNLD